MFSYISLERKNNKTAVFYSEFVSSRDLWGKIMTKMMINTITQTLDETANATQDQLNVIERKQKI